MKLIVRSMFSLVPGLRDLSRNIEAISIVDKYLEHTRVFVFGNAGEPRYFISSADFMQRNLDRRVEVTCPIYDPAIQAELRTIMEIQWGDNVKARKLDKFMKNEYRQNNSDRTVRSQWDIYKYLSGLNRPEKGST